MKNKSLIISLINNEIKNAFNKIKEMQRVENETTLKLADNISNLVMCLKEEERENALSLIIGNAETKLLSKEIINFILDKKDKKDRELIEISNIEYNILTGFVSFKYKYKYKDIKYYKDLESAEKRGVGYSYTKDNTYIYESIKESEDYDIVKATINEWNSGEIDLDKLIRK